MSVNLSGLSIGSLRFQISHRYLHCRTGRRRDTFSIEVDKNGDVPFQPFEWPWLTDLCFGCPGGWALIDGGDVAVPVDDLPLTVLAAVDVGDAQGAQLDWAAIYGP